MPGAGLDVVVGLASIAVVESVVLLHPSYVAQLLGREMLVVDPLVSERADGTQRVPSPRAGAKRR